jgi:hypothetical protein
MEATLNLVGVLDRGIFLSPFLFNIAVDTLAKMISLAKETI